MEQAFRTPTEPSPGLTLGGYLAERLHRAGCSTFFTVPGDFTLALLDELLSKRLRAVTTCNELNAGYAADGYSRATGSLGCAVVTFMVGGLSLLNAVAGAAGEAVPVLFVSGAPNSRDFLAKRVVHHSNGRPDPYQSERCFRPLVQSTFVVRDLGQAPAMSVLPLRSRLSPT